MIFFWGKICSGRRPVNSGARRIARSARCRKTRLSEGTCRNPAVVSTSRWLCVLSLAWGSFRSSLATQSSGHYGNSLPLALVEQLLSTTAQEDFGGRENVYEAAVEWSRNRFFHKNINNNRPGTTGEDYGAPYIVCSNSPRETLVRLESSLSPASVRKLAVGAEFGACFLATAPSPDVAAAVHEELSGCDLATYVMIYPSALKLAPGLLDHSLAHTTSSYDSGAQLATKHGAKMRIDNVGGLTMELSPGLLPARDQRDEAYMSGLWDDLLSTSINIWAANFWSDPAMSGGKHLNTVEGSLMRREWVRAADLVHEPSKARRRSPGSACGWDNIKMHQAGDDTIILTGLDHLLASGEAPAESEGAEFQMACFMGLVSFLASRAEVLRVAPYHRKTVLNAVAKAIIHSATTDTSETTLTAAGLDGTGEVIQVVDSGVDQDSCFFRDSDGETVEIGYYFDEIAVTSSTLLSYRVDSGGSFPVDLDRRKIVQYIGLVRQDVDGEDQPYGDYFTSASGGQIPWYSAEGFATETPGGHGSHTAGTAAGSAIGSLDSCSGDDELGCLGGCLNASYVEQLVSNGFFNVEVFCPKFQCDGLGTDYETCLSDDVEETVSANGGAAPGAKLAIFDTSADGTTVWAELAGNGLWEASNETGSVVHTNSWGGNNDCAVDASAIQYDTFMYQNPEHLLLFSVGNDGNLSDSGCTVGSPAIAKNVLTVGSSSSGQTRWTSTREDGEPVEALDDPMSDIDTVSYFSSQGPTEDGRIKPEIVAPGDQVLSASSAGVDGETCELELRAGTSMAAPVVAAAAVMIRQYFKDDSFYVSDLKARDLCDATTITISNTNTNSSASTPFLCSPFNASAATMKAMLINSANLMGGSSEPDGSRGFGRVHLDAGLPLGGIGDMGLFVADSSNTGVSQGTEDTYTFKTVDGDTGELRATLAWIDPPATTSSSSQLMHDLDLLVSSPSGQTYTMWSSGETDTSNVIERVVVSADDFDGEESGTWTISVSANDIVTESQPYSLVVTGPFGNGTVVDDSSMAAASLYRSVALVKSVLWMCVGLASALLAASCM